MRLRKKNKTFVYESEHFIRLLAENLSFLNQILQQKEDKEIKTSYGQKIAPFGVWKLRIIDIVALCPMITCPILINQLINSQIILTIFVRKEQFLSN
jgi:hypothetical protein